MNELVVHHGVLPGDERSFFPEWVLPHSHQNPLWFHQLLEDISTAQCLLCGCHCGRPGLCLIGSHAFSLSMEDKVEWNTTSPTYRLKWRLSKWIIPTQPWDLISEKLWCMLCNFYLSIPGRAGKGKELWWRRHLLFLIFFVNSAVSKRTLLAHRSINRRKIKQWSRKVIIYFKLHLGITSTFKSRG